MLDERGDGVRQATIFGDDRALFDDVVQQESRQWYLIEWSGAVAAPADGNLSADYSANDDNYLMQPQNASQAVVTEPPRSQSHLKNMAGTIRWIQRLPQPPTH
ncbi:MAG TPA: hypothetical protein VEL07_05595 [Planctomycetota bacterium]|nr:hypothetical protein [Planctomycetota bacterium]